MYPVTYPTKKEKRDYVGWLASIVNDETPPLTPLDILIINEFADVFPEDLPRLPPHREIKFLLDLVPSAAPISITPYRSERMIHLRSLRNSISGR